ncbi:hypothetical protein ERO13_D05G343466v2 [Gossypium hirsutum]|uniref:Uncharacterized protein n=1 Tax=Gossypium hirsutum TaxID=3635 RepID=A0ABM2ZZX9_GOSHI|nr:uncharacterized protein LOC121216827 [Gossypium hirsutum]KAG4149596.1 hypothetical protein ERO13_D05G343466v2 [Gossypium hirsutum]
MTKERARIRPQGIRPASNNRRRHTHVRKMHAPDGDTRAKSGSNRCGAGETLEASGVLPWFRLSSGPGRFGFRKLGLGSISNLGYFYIGLLILFFWYLLGQ